MDGLKDFKFGPLDAGMKFTIAATGAAATCLSIALPNKREKDMAALELYEKPMNVCTPEERKVAEFLAGTKRWNGFFQTKVYPITRKLPGAKTPFLNPYRDRDFGSSKQNEDD